MKYFLIFILCSIFSCSSRNTTDENTAEQHEIELLSQLIPILIGPNYFPPGPPSVYNPIAETRAQYEEREHLSYKKHLKRIADTTFKLTVGDTLKVVSENQIAGINNAVIGELGKFLMEDTIGTKLIDLEKIEPFLPYQIVDKHQKWDRHNSTYRGAVSFSRIAFNKNYTQALFRFDFNCNFDCGWGAFIFAEKINGRWEIIKKHELWVS